MRAAWTLLELVSLVHTGLKVAIVKSKAVVFFSRISTLCLRDPTANLIGVTKFVEGLIMGRLEVVVDHATLLLLSKTKVMAFQLLSESDVSILLCLSVASVGLLLNKSVLGLRDWVL